MALNEADSSRLHFTRKLQAAGWDTSPHCLNEHYYLRSEAGRHESNNKTKGCVRFRPRYDKQADISVPVPDDEAVQHRFAASCQRIEAARLRTLKLADQTGAALDAIRRESFLPEALLPFAQGTGDGDEK